MVQSRKGLVKILYNESIFKLYLKIYKLYISEKVVKILELFKYNLHSFINS
jgi:hypothetical protein